MNKKLLILGLLLGLLMACGKDAPTPAPAIIQQQNPQPEPEPEPELALSQKEILMVISEANPGNTLNWNETDNLSDWEEVTLDGNGFVNGLILDQRDLTIVPPEIGQLTSLVALNIFGNNLSSLPPEIGQLGSLESLDLLENNLSSLPPEIGQLGSLEILRLSKNNLTSLPPEIGQLGSLEILLSSSNNLSSLPIEIGELANLEVLELDFNVLSSLPPEIGQLGSLEILSLLENSLSSLPIELKQLVNLRTLDLSRNNLSQFDHVPFIPSGGFGGITFGCSTETNLETLRLAGNPDLLLLDQCICDLDKVAGGGGGTVNIDIVPDGVDCVANNVIGN